MTKSKRGRACDACHSIKIKCELGSTGGAPPCERCTRLGKQCVLTAPVRQKDRVAELEAKLEAMTRLLKAQNLRVPGEEELEGENGTSDMVSVVQATEKPSKKRRLESSPLKSDSTSRDVTVSISQGGLEIDPLVPRETQRRAFQKFRREIQPRFPVASLAATKDSDVNTVELDNKDYDTLRAKYPVLLQAIVFAGSQGMLSGEVQHEVTSVIISKFTPDAIMKASKTLDLIQAIQIVTLWYRPPIHHVHLSLNELCHLAYILAQELCIDKTICANPIEAPAIKAHSNLGDGRRTWMFCYILSTSMSTCIRLPNEIVWTLDDEVRLVSLDYSGSTADNLPSDRLLSQFIRGERLCEQIALQAGLYGSTPILEVTDLVTRQVLQNLIVDWQAQIPSAIDDPILGFYEYLATIFLNEHILQTPTNKRSFAAPFVAERMSVADFPAPFATEGHIISLNSLKVATQALLDLYTGFDIAVLSTLPAIFTAKAAYAEWILIKLYVACTALGNTYGAFIDPHSLRVEHYLREMINVGQKLSQVDDAGGSFKIMQSVERLREWIWKYNASNASLGATPSYPVELTLTSKDFEFTKENDWTAIDFSNDPYQYDAFGLDDLFGEI